MVSTFLEGDDTHTHFGQNVICRSSVLHFPLERWAGSAPLDGERETTSFKSIGRSERKRKDFYSPIYTYSELKPTVLLAVLWEEATSFKSVGRSERKRKDLFAWQYSSWWWEGNNFIQVYWERKTKDFCCFPLRVLPAVQLVLAHCMCIEQKRTQEPLAYVGSVRTLVGALLCTWGYLCLP